MTKINTLILGGGIASRRYLESLIWDSCFDITLCGFDILYKTASLAQEFGLPYVPYSKLNHNCINQYRLIIFCLPLSVKLLYLHSILQDHFSGTVILEKPLATNLNQIHLFQDCLSYNKHIAVICLRDFLINEFYLPTGKDYHISFYSHTSDLSFNVIHQLPHILSLLIRCGHRPIYSERNGTELCFSSNDNHIYVSFHSTPSHSLIVNGDALLNVNYREYNKKVIKRVLQFTDDDFVSNQNRAIQVSSIIESVLDAIKMPNFYGN